MENIGKGDADGDYNNAMGVISNLCSSLASCGRYGTLAQMIS